MFNQKAFWEHIGMEGGNEIRDTIARAGSYKKAGLNVDRREAIDFALKFQTNALALDFLKTALYDKSEAKNSYTQQIKY